MTQIKRILMGTASCLAVVASAQSVSAQDTGDGYLGVLLLGENKRDIQTDVATAITTVDEEEIRDRQAGTISELIDSVPGVNLVNGATAAGAGINIRGFGANGTYGTDQKVLIRVDGVTRGSEELYRIGNQLYTDPFLYKEVSVIRGTVGSFEYGSGVVGGSVQLVTKDASDLTGGEPGFKFRQALEFETNGDGITSSSILAWQPTEDLEFLANYTRRTLGIQDDGSGNLINPDAGDVDDPSYLLKGKYTFGANRDQSLTFAYSDTDSDQRDVPYDAFARLDFGNVDRTIRNKTAELTYRYNPVQNDLIDLSVTLSYSDEVITNDAITPGSSLLDADHQYETTALSFRNTSLFDTGAVSHDLRTGLEFIQRDRLDAYAAYGGVDDRIALFAVDDMTIAENLTLTPALRYETSHVEGSTAPNDGTYDNDALMGGLSARYAFGNGFAVFGSAAYTENLPIIDDLNNSDYMEQPEKSRTFEVGASFRRADLFADGDVFAIKANLYQTALWDVTSYSGTESVDTKGLELEASYSHNAGYYVDLNTNIARGKGSDSDGVKTYWDGVPADSLRVTFGKTFGEELDLSWEVVANDGMTRTDNPSAGFAAHNLRATYVPQSGVLEGTEVRFGVENVFDRQYQPHLWTRAAPGRNFKLTLARTF
ncbi:TonB-dependent receptor domain-containing protein [Actibacterium lipolyticum]|nr:TonB-dependent receptor [Actibacterium lipolyticum]